MYRDHTISLVIPCLNEEKGIREVLARIPDCVDAVVVVDNGSTDKTAAIASSLGANVIFQPQKGYGLAYRTGFKHCKTDLIATIDGDGTYPVEMVPELIDHLLETKADFMSCNRFPVSEKQAMPPHRLFGNMFLTYMICFIFRIQLKDGLSGMWIFHERILDHLILKSNRWSFSQEIKIEVLMQGLSYQEFHIPYAERIGQTKLGPISVGCENLAYLIWHKIQWILNMRK